MTFSSSFTDGNIFAALMNFFMEISTKGIASMIPYASYLICIFAIIDLCTSWYLYDGQMKFSVMISKIIKIGAFFFLVIHWGDITAAISKSFSYIGYVGGGHSPTEAATLVNNTTVADKSIFNPSYIIDLGNSATSNISKAYMEAGSFNFGQIILYGICWCLVLIGFYFIALQVLLTNIEFSIFTCLAIILLPFGCVKYTAFLSQRAISGVFSFGIKLMVVYFLLGIVASLGDSFGSAISTTTDKNGSVAYSFVLKQALAYITVGYLVWKLPTLVAGMMQGGTPSLGNDITPSAPIAAGAAALGTTGAAIKNVRAAFEAGGDQNNGSSSNAAGAANKAAAASSSDSGGIMSRTPILNRNATFGKIAQYKAQWSNKSLGGKAMLAGKILALAGAQATVDTAKVGGAVGRAVFGQTGVYRSYRGSLDSGTWHSKRQKDEQKQNGDQNNSSDQG